MLKNKAILKGRFLRRIVTLVLIISLLLLGNITTVDNTFASETFKITEESRFFIIGTDKPDEDVMNAVKLANSQFAAYKIPSSKNMEIVYGSDKKIKAGDIAVLVTGRAKSERAKQSFNINVKEGYVQVTAFQARGLLYGLNTLLKEVMAGNNISGLNVSQMPDCTERTVLLDCGRKYYSAEWIKNFIKQLSWQKYTSLELHFSETHGMRVESKKFPWLNEADGKYLTFDELKSICRVANQYNIEIIPDLDTPGHMDYIVQKYAEYVKSHPDYSFEYEGKTYNKNIDGFSNISNYYTYNGAKSEFNYAGIDISNETAVAFTNALIDEYADFFAKYGSTKFNIGGDELFGWTGTTVGGRTFGFYELWGALEHWQNYARNDLKIKNGSASDAFIAYLNTLSGRLEKKGYTCRVWNDEIHRDSEQHIELNKDIDVVYWSNDYYPVDKITERGNKIYNTNTGWCYYVIREDKRGGDIMDRTRKRCNSYNIFTYWNPRNCANPKDDEKLVPKESFAGAYFAIWADNPDYKSQKEVYGDVKYRMWANSAKQWNSEINREMSYSEYKKYIDNFVDFPGFSGDVNRESELAEAPDASSQLSILDKIIVFFKNL